MKRALLVLFGLFASACSNSSDQSVCRTQPAELITPGVAVVDAGLEASVPACRPPSTFDPDAGAWSSGTPMSVDFCLNVCPGKDCTLLPACHAAPGEYPNDGGVVRYVVCAPYSVCGL